MEEEEREEGCAFLRVGVEARVRDRDRARPDMAQIPLQQRKDETRAACG